VEGLVEVLEGSLPAVVTCDKGLNTPRYANIKGIMAAKKKPIETLAAAELGADLAERVTWESLELPPARQAGKILQGDPAEAARELARLLREEAKVL
jgi:electron transfer flavoprotein beta subunit